MCVNYAELSHYEGSELTNKTAYRSVYKALLVHSNIYHNDLRMDYPIHTFVFDQNFHLLLYTIIILL